MANSNKINILYHSCPYDLSGYGTVSRNHLLALRKYNDLNIRLKVKTFWRGVSPDLGSKRKALEEMERNPIPNDNFIFFEHLTPENYFIDPRAKYHIGYTPFETDGAPLPWLLPFRAMDEIWVPSYNNKESYINAGVKPSRIIVIPHGVDIANFNTKVKPLKYNRGKFNFGSIFDWTERKNPIALIRAYYNAFCKGEDVTLTIRTFWRFPIERTREHVMGEIEKIKSGYGERKDFPKILFWFDTMDEESVPSFYRSFDCFVLPTRGEGFGLPFIEAMACGIPSIGPNWGGNIDFMNSDNSLLIGGTMQPIAHHDFLRLQPQYTNQNWFDINESELSQTMRWVYDNEDKAKKLGSVGAKDVSEKWTWNHTADKIHDRFLQIEKKINKPHILKSDMDFVR